MRSLREMMKTDQSYPHRITGTGGFLRSWLGRFAGWKEANLALRTIQRLSVAAITTATPKPSAGMSNKAGVEGSQYSRDTEAWRRDSNTRRKK